MKYLSAILFFAICISMVVMFYIVVIPVYLFLLVIAIVSQFVRRFLVLFRRRKITVY